MTGTNTEHTTPQDANRIVDDFLKQDDWQGYRVMLNNLLDCWPILIPLIQFAFELGHINERAEK